VYSDDVEEDKVAEQDTEADTKVNKGETVVYHLSKGADLVKVPDVVGQSEANAKNMLEDYGFSVKRTYEHSSTVTAGDVISQDKTGRVSSGSSVTIVVSNGPESVSVPNVVGMAGDVATDTISNAGLRYDVQGNGSVVTRQSPSAGTSVKGGDTVTLYMEGGHDDGGNNNNNN
jgi:serine/threonine-protein kinase